MKHKNLTQILIIPNRELKMVTQRHVKNQAPNMVDYFGRISTKHGIAGICQPLKPRLFASLRFWHI